MDRSFEDLFNGFYLKLTLLNYRFRSKLDFLPSDLNIIKHLKILIPIFNRLDEKDDLTIDDVKNFTSKEEKERKKSSDDYPFVDTIQNNSLKEQNTSNEEYDEEDPEGDKQIEELTKKSLAQLEAIKNRGWIIIEIADETEITETYSADDEDNEYVSEDDVITHRELIQINI